MNATPQDEPGRWLWLALPIGTAFIVFGIHGIVVQRSTPFGDMARWFIGAGVVHDAFLAPVFVAAGVATMWLPAAARVPVRLALAASALITVMTWPLVRGWGRRASNPSALPLDYGRNLVIALVAIWLVALVAIAVRVARR